MADGGVSFAVWAPTHGRAVVRLDGGDDVPLAASPDGVHRGHRAGLEAGARYRVALDDGPAFPDPASRAQPAGVHGPSEVVDPGRFGWVHDDAWAGLSPERLLIYELHVGTFTPEGTFDALRRQLPYLKDLGVTAVELMPVHDYPGQRGWGYDPAALFAPCRAYGRPDDLRRLVDEAHGLGLGVLLDVVYNHLGPDGAYWAAFGPVLTDRHRTPWGDAVNLDGEHARGVRDMILLNAVRWLTEYRFDGLRLDATFALIDRSEEHLLAEMARRVSVLPGPPRLLIAEDNRRVPHLVRPRDEGGFGLDGIWADDFHHLVRRYLTGDEHAYFAPFPTSTAAIAQCVEERWYRHPVGPDGAKDPATDAADVPAHRFVTCIQNHDQVGNRPRGDRLHHAIAPDVYRAASALLLFAPQAPLLFMGQEWATASPFQYFTDHGPELGARVQQGRREEFRDFPGFDGDVPDPQSEATFLASKLDPGERDRPGHRETLALYRALIALRGSLAGDATASSPVSGVVRIERGAHAMVVRLTDEGGPLELPLGGTLALHTEEARFGGSPAGVHHDGSRVRLAGPAAVVVRSTPLEAPVAEPGSAPGGGSAP